MKNLFFVFFLFSGSCMFSNQAIAETETVNVGGYVFPPFVEEISNQYVGITIDLISEMNSFQNKYKFQFVSTSPKRRFRAFDKGTFDLIMFEDKNWGLER